MKAVFLVSMIIHSRAEFYSDEQRYSRSMQHLVEPPAVAGEMGGYFEGDMLLTEEQVSGLFQSGRARNGLVDLTKRWPGNTLVYVIAHDEFDDGERATIASAMAHIANSSFIRFRERANKEHAARITSASSGCFSYVGYVYDENNPSEEQVLNLGRGCVHLGTVVHELLHALGFHHMQSSHNRDDYVRIVWSNIQEGQERNFRKYEPDTVTDFGLEYDYGSVMHYSTTAFSKNGNRTIIPFQEGAGVGQRRGLSPGDAARLREMYCRRTRSRRGATHPARQIGHSNLV